jgi:hypothetical protein
MFAFLRAMYLLLHRTLPNLPGLTPKLLAWRSAGREVGLVATWSVRSIQEPRSTVQVMTVSVSK